MERCATEFSVTPCAIVEPKNSLLKDDQLRSVVGFYRTSDNLSFRFGNAFIHTANT